MKVDIQNLVETIGNGFGGRVALTRRFQGALELSVARNFKDNNITCCMSHNSNSMYKSLFISSLFAPSVMIIFSILTGLFVFSSKRSAVVRVSEDFMP